MTMPPPSPGLAQPAPGPRLSERARARMRALLARAVEAGAPPGLFGFRHVREETAEAYVARALARGRTAARYRTVHPPAVATNALPANVPRREALPDDRGWWGYSMRDVPERPSGETWIATLPDATVVPHVDAEGRYWPAILSCDGTAIAMREIRFRRAHGQELRRARAAGRRPRRIARATWVTERVYDNYSHWLTAHLPKLLLLKDRGELGEVILPRELKPAMEASLARVGIDPAQMRRVPREEILSVGELTLVGTDRFRPELLRRVREAAFEGRPRVAPHRRVYVSRARARFRRLRNEEEVWPILAARGFERVFMEDLDFDAQVQLMAETRVLVAPHGAGLTNMMFAPEETDVVEIAALSFPNPNFYAVAAAMGQRYHLVDAEAVGAVRPLEQDLQVAPEALTAALETVAGLAEPSPARAGV